MNYVSKKAMYYDSTEIKLDSMLWGLLELGVDVERSDIVTDLVHINEEEAGLISKEVKNYDFAITQNFNVNVAEGCHNAGVIYISWIYDSPQVALFTDYAKYTTNYIFCFDKTQCKRLKDLGLPNVFYRPLASNIAFSSTIDITNEDISKYSCDISFIGKMYRINSFSTFSEAAPQDVMDKIGNVADRFTGDWKKGTNIYDSFDKELSDILVPLVPKSDLEYFTINPKYIVETFLLGPAIAQRERSLMLRLSTRIGNTAIYTKEDDMDYALQNTGANVFPPVWHELPYKVYYSSKINLNLTLRTIETGVPQRIFDIMSVGGMVMSNYQEEIPELFDLDKEIVVFHSPEEFQDKARFYLAHDDLREKIGINGYLKVKDKYNYVKSLQNMFSKI